MSKVLLGDVACERRETCKGSKEGYPVVGLEHLAPEEITLSAWDEGKDNTFTKLFRKGDVLFGRRRAYLKKAAVAPFDGICSGDITVIQAIPDKILPELLPFIIQNDALFDFAVGKSAGSLSPRVKWEHLKNYSFELPDMEEQHRLAKILWAMDATKKAYQKLIQKTDELVKSQFIARFETIPEEYYLSLNEVCTLITDGTHQPPKFVDRGIPFLLVSNITGNKLTYDTTKFITEETYNKLIRRTPVEIGDVLLSTVGSYGHPALVTDSQKFCFQRHIAFLKPNRNIVSGSFLHAALLSENAQRQIESLVLGVAQKTLNLSAIKQIKIPIPCHRLQDEYVQLIQQSDKSKFAALNVSNLNLSRCLEILSKTRNAGN